MLDDPVASLCWADASLSGPTPGGAGGSSHSLFVASNSGTVHHFTLDGRRIGSVSMGSEVRSLEAPPKANCERVKTGCRSDRQLFVSS
jgi:hypothetical protein